MEELFKLSELKKILKISYPTILGYVHKGELKAVRVGNQWRVAKSDFELFVKEHGFVAPIEEPKIE